MSDAEQNDNRSKSITIIVNGQEKPVPEAELTYDDLLRIAAMDPPKGGSEYITISYTGGPKDQPTGFIEHGMSIKPTEKMIFNVTRTDKS